MRKKASTSKTRGMAGESNRGRKRKRVNDADLNGSNAEEQSVSKRVKVDADINGNIEISDRRSFVSHVTHKSTEGRVVCMGEGDTGQLGLGPDVMERTKPGPVNLPPNVIQVCSGGMHTVCVTKEGVAYSWGCNDEGALGRVTEDEDDIMVPDKVDGLDDVKLVQVSAGDSHSAGLAEDGQVYAWGIFRDANGKIGLTPDGNTVNKPLKIMPDLTVTKIASGGDHLVALTDKGEVYTVGCAEQGQLGRVAECFTVRGGRKGLDLLLTPHKVHFPKRNIKLNDIWTGQYVTYAKDDNGKVYAWGLNNYFQLGFSDMKNRFVPELSKSFTPDKQWKEVSGGQHHTVALDNEGTVYSLGRHDYGRLGLGEGVAEKHSPTPVPQLEGKKCVAVNSGSCVSFAVTQEGEVYAWGMGTNKQLGNSDEEDIWEPTVVKGKQLDKRKSLQVSAGGQHTVILAADVEEEAGKAANSSENGAKH